MKNIYSNIVKFNNKNLTHAIKFLNKNHAIGVPTETVYGLAGNAYSNISVKRIYKLKNRPLINPVIIHYHNLNQIKKDVLINKKFLKLYGKLCPGPITFILKKKNKSKVSNIATAKLQTIAIRFPQNPIIRKILKRLKFPLAIPSANKSTRVSPVRAEDVAEEFGKKLKLIFNGGRTKVGIESTVLDLTGTPKILRPGIINKKELSKILKTKVISNKKINKINSPGQMKKHYSPGIPIKLNQTKMIKKHAYITFGKQHLDLKNTFNLSKKSNLKEAAKNLYSTLRTIKKLKYKKVYVAKIPNKGVGIAINNRLKHAAN